VLVVEDEVKMAGLLRRGLEEEGLAVDVSGSGHDARWQVGLGLPPAVVESSRSLEWRNYVDPLG
jgi:DNA-binding response OmpR family regulator